jgi:hypothetical protein
MFTRDVRFEGFSVESWIRFLDLWRPRADGDREKSRAHGGLFVVREAGKIRKILHLDRGRLPLAKDLPDDPAALAERFRASWVLSWENGALEELMERFGARLRRDDELGNQILIFLGAFRELVAEGSVTFWPQRLAGVPIPSEETTVKALDAVVADGHCILLGLFEHGELYTAVCARRRNKGFDLLAGPEALRPSMGLLSGDFRRDYRHLISAAEKLHGPLSFGCFAEVGTFRALQVDPEPGAWSRAVAVRDIVLSPVPTAVGVAVGIDAVRVAAEGVRTFTAKYDTFGLFDLAFREAKKRLEGALDDRDVAAILGFEPMSVLRLLLRRE